jgi:hypothetical protein
MGWEALAQALDARAAAGRPAGLWLRDDDAVAPTAALDRLLALAEGLPLTIAAIPAGATPALAARLAGVAGVRVAVHGWAHANHAGPGEKSQELGPHRPAGTVAAELAQGLARLRDLFGPQCLPLLVPPWNRISPGVAALLPGTGLAALSVFGPETPGPVPQVNTHLDPIDWRGTRGGRPGPVLAAELAARIAAGAAVTGILTHHLVHDAAVWDFLACLVAATRGHPGAAWLPAEGLFDGS